MTSVPPTQPPAAPETDVREPCNWTRCHRSPNPCFAWCQCQCHVRPKPAAPADPYPPGEIEASDWWCTEAAEPRQVACCTACIPSLSALLSEFYNSDDGDYVSALGDIHKHVAAREAAARAEALRDALAEWEGGPTGQAPIPHWWLEDRIAREVRP